MAWLTEAIEWALNIYRIELADFVEGGEDGVSNLQAKQLAARTNWLRLQYIDGLRTVEKLDDGANAYFEATETGAVIRIRSDAGTFGIQLPDLADVETGAPFTIVIETDTYAYQSTIQFVALGTNSIIDVANTSNETPAVNVMAGSTLFIMKKDAATWLLFRLNDAEKAPVGQVAAFAMNTPPVGWLACNGASLSVTAYKRLYKKIGIVFGGIVPLGDDPTPTHFSVPDLRGEFIRGWDNGRGIDSGRTFGSQQFDAFEEHSHTISIDYGNFTDVTSGGQMYGAGAYEIGDVQGYGQTSIEGDTETRPRNKALLYCIKYR